MLSQGNYILYRDVKSAPDLDPRWRTTLDDKPIVSFAIFPMRVQGRVIGTVNYLDVRAPIDLSDDENDLMQSIADQAGSIISLRDLSEATVSAQEAVTNLVSASRQITAAVNYTEMTYAIKQTLAKDASLIILTAFNEALEEGKFPTQHVLLGLSLVNQEADPDNPLPLELPPERFIPIFHQGKPVILSGEAAVERIPEPILSAFGLPPQEWMGIFPLRSGRYLIGTMSIIGERDLQLSEAVLTSYSTLTDQIGMAVRSRQLLLESQRLQQVASQLVQAEHAIALTDTYSEMLQVILGLLPLQIDQVFLLLFDRTFVSSDAPIEITLDSYATRDTHDNLSITDIMNAKEANWVEGMEHLRMGAFITTESVAESYADSPNIVQHYLDQGVESIITTGLRVGRNIIGLLVMSKESSYQLRADQESNLRAIVDQLATTVENRQLLQQTTASLTETTTLFNVNRDLLNTQNDVDILQVIYQQAVPHSLGIISAQVIYNIDSPQDLQLETLYNGELVEIDRSLAHEIGIGGVVTYLKAQHYPALVFLSDVQSDSSSAAIFKLAGISQTQSAVFMPIYDEDQLLRVLAIGFAQPRPFDDSEKRLFSSIRSQIQIVLQNQRLLVEMQRAAVRLGRQVQSLQTINHMIKKRCLITPVHRSITC